MIALAGAAGGGFALTATQRRRYSGPDWKGKGRSV